MDVMGPPPRVVLENRPEEIQEDSAREAPEATVGLPQPLPSLAAAATAAAASRRRSEDWEEDRETAGGDDGGESGEDDVVTASCGDGVEADLASEGEFEAEHSVHFSNECVSM